ncbi:MAG TPA: hypothetical protein VHX14_08815 [Thermoanaerobaculia bacterium]|jgi:hypothetical protein|nr:hypothetical protein [Thermoanaerobaculia bacterium]
MSDRTVSLARLAACALSISILACDSGVKRSEIAADRATQQTATATNSSVSNANPTSAAVATNTLPAATATNEPELNGWGSVTWGMTETEVRAAYPAVVAIDPPDDYDRAAALATLRLPGVRAADLDFAAIFLFSKSTHGLSRVFLRRDALSTSEYAQILSALNDKYGAPSREKRLGTASVDTSSAELEAKTRIGSASSAWVSGKTTVGVEYFEALGTRYLIVSYKPRSEEPNL